MPTNDPVNDTEGTVPVIGLISSGVDTVPHPAIGEAAGHLLGEHVVGEPHLDATDRIEMGFPHDIFASEMARSLSFGGMRDRIDAR